MNALTAAVAAENHYVFRAFEWLHLDGTICRTPHNHRTRFMTLKQRIVALFKRAKTCAELHISRLKWTEEIDNLVVTAGLNLLLDSTLKTGASSPVWYVGLVDNASFSAYAAGDTMSSHAGWIEGVPYSNSTRVTWTPGSISGGSVSNSGSLAVFTINADLTLRGGFLTSNSTKSGSTGTLYGVGDFDYSRVVHSGDTLSAQITCTATAS